MFDHVCSAAYICPSSLLLEVALRLPSTEQQLKIVWSPLPGFLSSVVQRSSDLVPTLQTCALRTEAGTGSEADIASKARTRVDMEESSSYIVSDVTDAIAEGTNPDTASRNAADTAVEVTGAVLLLEALRGILARWESDGQFEEEFSSNNAIEDAQKQKLKQKQKQPRNLEEISKIELQSDKLKVSVSKAGYAEQEQGGYGWVYCVRLHFFV